MKSRAFSLVELLAAVSLIGVLASIAYVGLGNITAGAKQQKLTSDTDTLNRAVKVYVANGGSLAKATTPAAVITKLKSAVAGTEASRLPGMSSQVIDPRLSFELASGDTGVTWDATNQKFVVGGKGSGAIKRFFLDESLAEVAAGKDSREAMLAYSAKSSWIWDFQDTALPGFSPGGTPIITTVPPDSTTPPSPVEPPSPPPIGPPSGGTLEPPTFSIPGGNYSLNNYNLPVTLTDPNPAGKARLVYALDFGPWVDYSQPLTIPPGSTVSAQAISLDTNWDDSSKLDQSYDADPLQLTPPTISPDRDSFGLFFGLNITVTLIDPNKTGVSQMRYRLDGGPWIDYTGPFNLFRFSYPSGVTVEAQAYPTSSPYYLASSVSTRPLTMESLDLTGSASGVFQNPTGPAGMVTNLGGGATSSYFEWGDDNHPSIPLSKSWMQMSGGNFGNIAAGERFEIGDLTYYNGTILADTGADTIDLSIGLSLDINGNIFNPFFDFTFELINSVNLLDPNNPWPDADYVQIVDARSSRTLVINDTEFEFRLEFGDTTPNGFASFDQFHVLESADASVNVYGTFIELGPIAPSAESSTSSILEASKGGSVEDLSVAAVDSESGEVIAYQKEGYVDTEEGATTIEKELESLKAQATTAADQAESDANEAERLYSETLDKIAEGLWNDANEKATQARSKANDAALQAQAAEDAATKAQALATEIEALANQDPSLESKALGAIDDAVIVASHDERAQTASIRANNAATSAEAEIPK